MALTGLQIQKLLPKTNCKECGSNTCLAFAMKLAAKKADLAECPYASDEAKEKLGAASEPPVKLIELGANHSLKLGEETVFYRHEKTYVNQTAIAINIDDITPAEEIDQILQTVIEYELERVGETLIVDMIAVSQVGTDAGLFKDLVKKAGEKTQLPLVIKSSDFQSLAAAAEIAAGSNSVLVAAGPGTLTDLIEIAKKNGHALAVSAPGLDQLTSLTAQAKETGYNKLLLHLNPLSLAERFQLNSIVRKSALKNNFKPFGYPTISYIDASNPLDETAAAVTEISKFGGICVLPRFDPAQMVALMTTRMNIYTDPQKPIQVEPKVYPIGNPGPDSPVFVTTNFSLTFFIVSGEIENSGLSAWLVVPESEGMSVLTAWAAGKFSGASIAKSIKEMELEDQINTRKIIIPGYVAQISGELEEKLPGWKVVVGPQEAADLESFITQASS